VLDILGIENWIKSGFCQIIWNFVAHL
jgi:hypothetical protein